MNKQAFATMMCVLSLSLWAAAQSETKNLESPSESIEKFKDSLLEQGAPESSDGKEKGNLSERGAKELLTEANWKDAFEASKQGPVLIFKHSTDCPISGEAYRQVAKYLNDRGDESPPIYLVKVIERRPVSQRIAAELGVTHESPQMILLQDEKPVWNDSHERVNEASISAAVKKYTQLENDTVE